MSSLPPPNSTSLTETAEYEPGIYQIAKTDAVIGGDGGVSNYQAQQLANRTGYLYNALTGEIARAEAAEALKAPIANPTLTGGLTVTGTNNTVVAIGTPGTPGTPEVTFHSSGSTAAGQVDAAIYVQGGSTTAGNQGTIFLAAATTQVGNLISTGTFKLTAAASGLAMGAPASASSVSMTFYTSGNSVADSVFTFSGGTKQAGAGICQVSVGTMSVTGALSTGGAATIGGNATVGGTLAVSGGSAKVSGGANTTLTIGTPGTVGTPNICFQSSGSTTTFYDVEIYASGGDTGTTGTGTLHLVAAGTSVSGTLTAAGAISGPSLALAGSGLTIGVIPAAFSAAIDVNMPQGYGGNLLNLAINGTTLFATSNTGSCAMGGYLTVGGAFTAAGVATFNGGSAALTGGANTTLAIGTPGTAGSPAITFKSSGSTTTFCDVEIYASGGDTNNSGNGTLHIAAADTEISGSLAVAGQMSTSSGLTVGADLGVEGTLTVAGNGALEGIVTAITAAVGTSSTQLATTAFAVGTLEAIQSGYQVLPSGLIIQWGIAAMKSTGHGEPFNFQKPFPHACFQVMCSEASAAGWDVSGVGHPVPTIYGVTNIGPQQFQVSCVSVGNVGGASGTTQYDTAGSFYWLALGW